MSSPPIVLDGASVAVGGRRARLVPTAVAERLQAVAAFLRACGQAGALTLAQGDVRPGHKPGTVTLSRTAEERILRAADTAWAAAGHGPMPAPWRGDSLRHEVERLVNGARRELGRWGDELAWWLAPHDRVTPELAAQLGAILRAIAAGAAEEVLEAVRSAEDRANARRAALAQAKAAAAAECGPEPEPTSEEREALRYVSSPLPVPRRESWERDIRVGLGSAWAQWDGSRWVAHEYTSRVEYSSITASLSEDSRADGVGGPAGGGYVEVGRAAEVVITLGAPLPEDKQGQYAAEAERLYMEDVTSAERHNETVARRDALRQAYRERHRRWQERVEAAMADAERRFWREAPSASTWPGPVDVLLRRAGLRKSDN